MTFAFYLRICLNIIYSGVKLVSQWETDIIGVVAVFSRTQHMVTEKIITLHFTNI